MDVETVRPIGLERAVIVLAVVVKPELHSGTHLPHLHATCTYLTSRGR